MVLRSHSRGGRSSACALEPDSQAGSFPTGNENLRVQPTRQGKSRPEPEIPSSHGMGSISPPLGNNPTDNLRKTFSDNRSEAPTEHPEVVAGPTTPSQQHEVFTCFDSSFVLVYPYVELIATPFYTILNHITVILVLKDSLRVNFYVLLGLALFVTFVLVFAAVLNSICAINKK